MKQKNTILPQISLISLILAITQVTYSAEEGPEVPQEGDRVVETIPSSARFDLEDIEEDHYVLVGRLSLRRQFLGTRATPPYQDLVQFHCFNGEELKFSTFSTPELEEHLLSRLADGRSLPAMVTVQFEEVTVGHDGLNMSKRLMARIQACEVATAEFICVAAETAGFDVADSEQFKVTLDPDLVEDGVAVSIGKVSVRSETTPRGSAIAIHGIRVFNTTSDVATLEIIGLAIEQEGVSQKCVMSARSRAPQSWQVEAGDWSDGEYEKGEMPGILWMYDLSNPIRPDKQVEVQLELKLNGGESFVVARTVDPI